jgi:lipopolysaccharide assembly outer membrane protein LptD (OstA)
MTNSSSPKLAQRLRRTYASAYNVNLQVLNENKNSRYNSNPEVTYSYKVLGLEKILTGNIY